MTMNLRRAFLGRPLPTSHAAHTRLPKWLALAVFSSDALSSTAYATEQILSVLLLAGAANLSLAWPIALGIATLLVIVTISYRQTIFAYPNGGGAYIVAKDNLGSLSGLIAAASLLIDYILTVSVSVASGTDALASAVPALLHYRVLICIGFIILLTLANLRGLKESGSIFALPTYSFILSMTILVLWGIVKSFLSPDITHTALTDQAVHLTLEKNNLAVAEPISIFLILRAFASGCTALTGVEAISNGIPAFRKPESKNAAITLTWMAAILTSLFLGITWIARHYAIAALPDDANGYQTAISLVANQVFGGRNIPYYWVQFSTMAILVVAANTSYADFPRLASLLARDRYLPRQLGDLGDRLVFNNGIFVLAALAAALIVVFGGSVNDLIPLYAVGVFTSFSLSQSGMVLHWWRERGRGWQLSILVNGLGAIATTVVLLVIGITKFNEGKPIPHLRLPFGHGSDGSAGITINFGAWMVIALVPLLVWLFFSIHKHYAKVGRYLQSTNYPRLTMESRLHHTVVVLVPGLHRGIFPALDYARSLSRDARAVHIEIEPANTPNLKEEWENYVEGMPLVIIESPFRNLRESLVEYVEEVLHEREDDSLTIVIPELVADRHWWWRLLHNSSADGIRRALGKRAGVIITSYRYFAETMDKKEGPVAPVPTPATTTT